MSRVPSVASARVRRALGWAASVALLAGSLGVPVVAQDLPACGDERAYDCRLPDWSDAVDGDLPSLFGQVQGIVWLDDLEGDAGPGGLDILGVGLGRVDIADPGAIRGSDELLKAGKRKKAVSGGPGVLVRIVLDRPLDQVDANHSGVHVATDVDNSRSNNAPTGVAAPDSPFAASQDIYSLTWASTTGKTALLASNLAKGWYGAKTPFAAAWAAPNVLDMLFTPERFGQGFRVITHVDGDGDGDRYDSVSFGVGPIPSDGRVALVPTCIEGSISAEPFMVEQMVENGQTLRDVEAPASWRGGASLPVDDDTRSALGALIEANGAEADGWIGIPSTVSLFEDGLVIRQRPQLQIALDGDQAQLAVELGLTRRGYNVLRDLELEPTGDQRVDAWLQRATDSVSEYLPPFRSTKQVGLVAGEGIGSCIPWLAAEPGPAPVASGEPASDVPAANA